MVSDIYYATEHLLGNGTYIMLRNIHYVREHLLCYGTSITLHNYLLRESACYEHVMNNYYLTSMVSFFTPVKILIPCYLETIKKAIIKF